MVCSPFSLFDSPLPYLLPPGSFSLPFHSSISSLPLTLFPFLLLISLFSSPSLYLLLSLLSPSLYLLFPSPPPSPLTPPPLFGTRDLPSLAVPGTKSRN